MYTTCSTTKGGLLFNTARQMRKGLILKLQADSLTQSWKASPHPGREEDAKASRPTVAEHTTAALERF